MSDPTLDEAEINRLHREKMERRQAARRKVLATKTEERGLLIVHTGAGKGKSTAAFGMVLRCLGHGMRVGIVQFVKGAWGTGERDVLARFPPTIIITGTRAADLTPATYTNSQLLKAGVHTTMIVGEGMSHCFVYDTSLPEARDAYGIIVRFFNENLGHKAHPAHS